MSEDSNFSIEWHKGFQIGLYSGISKEQERIIKLLVEADTRNLTAEAMTGWYFALALIKGENK